MLSHLKLATFLVNILSVGLVESVMHCHRLNYYSGIILLLCYIIFISSPSYRPSIATTLRYLNS